MTTSETTKILFLCVANSARSQIAEGLAKQFLGPSCEIQSAGSHPSGQVHRCAIQVLHEIGINCGDQYSKSIEDLDPEFLREVNYVITLCAEEVCPAFTAKKAKRLHWGCPDPAGGAMSDAGRLAQFRKIRDDIARHLKEFKSGLT